MNLLIIDDDKDLLRLLELTFKKEYNVDLCDSAEKIVPEQLVKYNLIILDVMMDKMDGFEFLSRYRELIDAPIILLTAKSFEKDKIEGFALGADDYVTKPFNILEVKARIKAIMRRSSNTMIHPPQPPENSTDIVTGDLRLDVQGRRLFILGSEINVTSREFDLLKILVLNPNKVYSREELLNLVWGYEYPGDVRTVDVHIRRLREKIERNPSEPKYVFTKWGVGYYYKA